MQYIPIGSPFFLAFWLLVGSLVALIQIGILQYAFESLGVNRRYMFQGLGAPVASIGGAGKFDGIFLTGIVAVFLAGILGGRWHTRREIQVDQWQEKPSCSC